MIRKRLSCSSQLVLGEPRATCEYTDIFYHCTTDREISYDFHTPIFRYFGSDLWLLEARTKFITIFYYRNFADVFFAWYAKLLVFRFGQQSWRIYIHVSVLGHSMWLIILSFWKTSSAREWMNEWDNIGFLSIIIIIITKRRCSKVISRYI